MQTGFCRTICFLTVLLLIIAGCATPVPQMVGSKAPEFTLDRLGNGTVSLADLQGKPILLEFWAPWCPGCLDNITPMKELYTRFSDTVHILAPSLQTGPKTTGAFVKKHNIPYPIVFATRELLNAYQVAAIPVTIIIDSKGVIRYRHLGSLQVNKVSKKLEALLYKKP